MMKLFIIVLALALAHASEVAPDDQPALLQQPLVIDHEASPATTCSYQHYTALGDSFAAGFGADQRLRLCTSAEDPYGVQCTMELCGKDTGAYPYLFAAKYPPSGGFQYVPCSGAASDVILATQVKNSAAFGTPDLITVNAGGDDSEAFSTVARACMFTFGRYNSTLCGLEIDAANNTITNNLAQSLDNLFGAISQNAPSATVVVMSYIKFWANVDTTECAWPLNKASPDFKTRMNTLVDDINAKLQNASSVYGFKYANADANFEGHRVCSQLGKNSFKSWFQMFPKAGDDTNGTFYLEPSLAHPTIDGQQAYLSALETALGCS